MGERVAPVPPPGPRRAASALSGARSRARRRVVGSDPPRPRWSGAKSGGSGWVGSVQERVGVRVGMGVRVGVALGVSGALFASLMLAVGPSASVAGAQAKCDSPGVTADEIKVGVLHPQTGATFGAQFLPFGAGVKGAPGGPERRGRSRRAQARGRRRRRPGGPDDQLRRGAQAGGGRRGARDRPGESCRHRSVGALLQPGGHSGDRLAHQLRVGQVPQHVRVCGEHVGTARQPLRQ